jgi:hypothetical protein
MLTVPGFDPRLPGIPEYSLASVLSQGDFRFEIKLRRLRGVNQLTCRVAVVCLRNGCRIIYPSDLLMSEDYVLCRLSHNKR